MPRLTFVLLFSFALIAQTTPSALQLPISGRTSQSGSVSPVQTPVPGVTTSVNTLNTSVQVQGPYSGSALQRGAVAGKLTLRDAVRRGLEFNLGTVGLSAVIRQSEGQRRVVRSALMPNVSAALRENVQQTNLRALGVRIPFGPTIVGPFNYFDLRATLAQTLWDFTSRNNLKAAGELVKANEAALKDARDLVVLAVGGAYLQVIAATARARSAEAQIETAQGLFKQTQDQKNAGLSAQIDVNRSQVQLQTQQQRLASLQADLTKQKINLARLIGVQPNGELEIADDIPFSPAPDLDVDQALKQAYESRSDLRAAEAQVRAAEKARAAARAERLPSLGVSADYGVIGTNPAQSHGTFTVAGSLRIPIWAGGRTEGEIQQTEAELDQRRGELADVKGKIESDVRNSFLDLRTAAAQLEVARNNQQVARETLKLTRERFEAGISQSVEVLQAQEAVASSDLDYITALFAHNLAKISLARSIGKAEENYGAFLKLP